MSVAGYNDQKGTGDCLGIEQAEDLACLYINEEGKDVAVTTLNINELHVFILRCQAVEKDLVAFLEARIAEREAK